MTRALILSLASLVAGAALPATAVSGDDKPLYTVVDGTQVDEATYNGFKTWRAAACDRCHGPNQEGMVGPSLIESLKVLSKDDFKKTLAEGRMAKGMPAWNTNEKVMNNIDDLYAYLKGRSDGAITQAKVSKIK
ncbi:MAG: c-type cytochrome [Rhodocyclaceae bacterium]|nr:c-type cytochrome [Rhodocyclaceae bacterium]